LNVHDTMMRRLTMTVLCAGLTVGLGGCRHKTKLAPLPPILAPVALEPLPDPVQPNMVEVPEVTLPPPPIAAAAARPRERRRAVTKSVPVPEPPPAVVTPTATEQTPEDAAIGALTAGGEANPRVSQETAEMMAGIERQLNALPAQKAEAQKAQISKVRNFMRQAQEALSSGDAEGAKTLATKARLLLDDLEK